MRLPLPFLLYVTALGLFGWAGWTVYESRDLWPVESRTAATNKGRDDAVSLVAKGRGKGPTTSDWDYKSQPWWTQFKQVNLIGKLPERKPTAAEIAAKKKEEKPVVDMTPLDQIFELVSLVYDGKGGGKSGNSHIIIRYKPEAGVEPPEWWVRENSPPSGGGVARAPGMPRDLAAAPNTAVTKRPRGNRGNISRGGRPVKTPTSSSSSPMPTSIAGREMLQKIWVEDGGNIRRSSKLWGKYAHIRLVRVDSSAESAFFIRDVPAEEGQPKPEAKEEELLKTTADIPQDVLLALRQLQGREGDPQRPVAKKPENSVGWREVENTTRIGNQWHIGKKDERSFRDPDEFFSSVYVDTYVSKSSKLRGLSVRNIQPKMAAKFGVTAGDVLIEVNGRAVTSKGQAVNMVKKAYKRGVRTFTTKWLSNGQEIERVYQAPNK